MFTIEEVQYIHNHLAGGLPEYVTKLGGIGVHRYVTYITNGHSEYFGDDNNSAKSAPIHESYTISAKSNRDAFLKAMYEHEHGKIDYFTFSKRLANAGVEKWEVDVNKRTITFWDVAGHILLSRPIPFIN